MTAILLCLAVVIVLGACALIGCLLETRADPYVPEAAEAPDPVDEHFKSSSRVVAGSDIDRQQVIQRANDAAVIVGWLNVDPDLAALNARDLSAYYVTPETNS